MKTKQPLARKASDHVEDLLDDALAQTFPASDPIAVSLPTRRPDSRKTWSVPDFGGRHSGVT
jgi:hypothetical protein